MAPQKQLENKQLTLQQALGECVPARWLSPLRGPVSAYRSKARLGVKFVGTKGRTLVGFREKMSPFVAEIEACKVLAEPVGGLIPAISALMDSLQARARIPQIEVAISDAATALVLRHLDPLAAYDLAKIRDFAAANPVHIYLQPGGPDTAQKVFPEDGEPRLYYSLPNHGLTFAFHPLDFTQINQAINRKLVDLALELLAVEASDRIADLFCGIGNFSLPLARKAQWVTGVEGAAAAVERARENAAGNGVSNCEFRVGDLFTDTGELDLSDFDKVLLDPPRSGAAAVCEKLANNKVERVVYVSCNPATLARDAKALVESGYRLEAAGVIDMFPHTMHVESIACFVR